ncbi:putative glycolipid-binding domain-containing protein [Gordonia soli]|uniref:Glycolipid-binding domain-containing protein n=1 Tax=Gordonia soli NBRC 108243 TaxID=1223545 RepID=M0QGE7_9ACTN|nr:putative glycolipid-binding domain-containing protein [Gordonia soli]GAC67705.1 hypothetical protein GS4_09_00190 [Gordonia soli NBRC 108243]
MSPSDTAAQDPAQESAPEYKTLITWRGEGTDRLEQVRVHVSGERIKAYGRIIAAADGEQEAFSASYELVTNDLGVTKRLSVHLVRESGETQIGILRDGEHNWLIQTSEGTIREDFSEAQDVDLALSPLFNALPIRRRRIAEAAGAVEVPVAYLYLPSSRVEAATLTYTPNSSGGIDVVSPVANSTITIDDNGFVVDYTDLAHRV